MRYVFPVILLAASILLCVCAAPSMVSTLYPAADTTRKTDMITFL